MNHYEAKQEARRERLENAAKRAAGEASALSGQARRMADVIPLGQPVMIGHHSEGRDRNYRAKISRTFDRAHEAHERSTDLAARAASVGTGGISSDDPEAVDKLRAELAELTTKIENMKKMNKAHAAFLKDPASLESSDLSRSAQMAIRSFVPQWSKDRPFTFQLTNAGANARRIQKRIDELAAGPGEVRETVIGGGTDVGPAHVVTHWRIVDSVENNRVMVTFTEIPNEETRSQLKSCGFKWAPSLGSWVRLRNNAAWSNALYVMRASNS